MIKTLIAALRGSNKPRKDVVTRLVVNGLRIRISGHTVVIA